MFGWLFVRILFSGLAKQFFRVPSVLDLVTLVSKCFSRQVRALIDEAQKLADAQKRLAVQTAAVINQAFDTLTSPLSRAQYLLERKGISADQESYVTTDGVFLMQQIELREALGGVTRSDKPWLALERLRSTVESTYQNLQNEFQQFYSAETLDSAFNTVAKMQFFNKLLHELEQLEYELEDL